MLMNLGYSPAFTLKKEIALGICPERPAFDTLVDLTDEGLSTAEVTYSLHAILRYEMERDSFSGSMAVCTPGRK